jgi:hypothetical protein
MKDMVQDTAENRPRFRINPVEVVIFFLVLAGFGLSLYGLYRQTVNLKLSRASLSNEEKANRIPASIIQPDALKLEISCSKNPGFQFPSHQCE